MTSLERAGSPLGRGLFQLTPNLSRSTTTSSLIDRSRADLWIASRNVSYIEQGSPFSERKLYQVRATPGVASAEKYFPRFAIWKHGG